MAPGPPAAPSNLSVVVDVADVTLSWRDNASDETGFRVYASTSPDFAGPEVFEYGPDVTSIQLFDDRAPTHSYLRVTAFNAYGESSPSNVVEAITTAPTAVTRFINDGAYAIVSLTIDGFEQLQDASRAFGTGGWYEIDLPPGTYSYRMASGFWDGSSRVEMFFLEGTVAVVGGQANEVVFDDPTIQQLLTGFGTSQRWEGQYFIDTTPHLMWLRFNANGTWTRHVDGGPALESGTYSLLRWNTLAHYVEFQMGSDVGTLWFTDGSIVVANGPPDWPMIQYFPG